MTDKPELDLEDMVESKQHERLKCHIGRLLTDRGWNVKIDKLIFEAWSHRFQRFVPMKPDVFAEKSMHGLSRKLYIEVHGPKFHSQKHDRRQQEDILEAYPDFLYFEFHFWQLKNMPDKIILQELGIEE